MKNKYSSILSGLLFIIAIAISTDAYAATTFTSPATGTVTVTNGTQWVGATTPDASGAWTSAGSGTPYTYVIQANFTVIIGSTTTVDLSADAGTTIEIYGQVGFKSGNNNLILPADGTIDIKSGGQLGFGDGPNHQGNAAANVTIGTNDQKGPFLFYGPDVATQASKFSSSTFWTGASSTSWTTAGNWDNGVPASGVNAIIPTTYDGGGTSITNFPVIGTSVNVSVNSITIYTGATLTLQAQSNLTVNETLTNDGTVTINSRGNLHQTTTSTIAGSGTYNMGVQTWGDWNFISSPMNNVSVSSFGIAATGTNGGQIIPSTTSTCDPTAVDETSPYGNILELHEDATIIDNCAQSFWFVKSAGSLTNGRGYSVAGATTLNFSGTINNGNITYAGLTRQANNAVVLADGGTTTSGWHLVGNPYPSAIELIGTDLTAMGFDGQIQLWDNGSWTASNPSVTEVVPAGQAFQIKKTSIGGTADFDLTNADRGTNNSAFLKSQEGPSELLNITLDNATHKDKTSIYFCDGATSGYDSKFDANRFSDPAIRPMIYSIIENNELLAYNALPFLEENDTTTVNIGVRTEVYGAHSLLFTDITSLRLDAVAVLKDKKLSTQQIITEGMKYDFITEEGDAKDRFEITFSTGARTTEEVATGIVSFANSKVQLFPNPTSGNTKIVLGNNHNIETILVTDISGRTIQTYTVNGSTEVTINSSELKSGLYIVKVTGESKTETIKLIKK